MSKYYVQCYMRCAINYGHKIDVAWIPEKFAKKGKWLKIKQDGVWEDGWQVMAVFSKKRASDVERSERDYLKQRSTSDV